MSRIDKQAFTEYGENYIDYVIERDGVEAWRKWYMYHDSFSSMLANANYPPFDPAAEIGIDDPDGEGYEIAKQAAWDALNRALELNPDEMEVKQDG